MSSPTCATCRFYVVTPPEKREGCSTLGTCHRAHPIVMAWPKKQGVPAAEWPEVHGNDWCGEYERADDSVMPKQPEGF